MEIEIVERRENPLLSREEILVKIKNKETPSRKQAKEMIVAKTGADPENVIIKRITGRSGAKEFIAEVVIYQDGNVMKIVEPMYMLKRNGVIQDGEAQAQ